MQIVVTAQMDKASISTSIDHYALGVHPWLSHVRVQAKFRVELPGYPILGDGKGDNQNHAIPFMRGVFTQCIDANQGAYFDPVLNVGVATLLRHVATDRGRWKYLIVSCFSLLWHDLGWTWLTVTILYTLIKMT